jgi:hypothetical protein
MPVASNYVIQMMTTSNCRSTSALRLIEDDFVFVFQASTPIANVVRDAAAIAITIALRGNSKPAVE